MRLLLALLLGLALAGCGSQATDLSAPLQQAQPSGRQLLSAEAPAAVPSVDALGAGQAALVYSQVALFTRPQAACQALAAISSALGAPAVYTLMADAQANSEGLLLAFAANLGTPRAADSLTAIAAPPQSVPRNLEVQGLLGPAIPTMPYFHALRELDPATLLSDQQVTLRSIRDRLSYPGDGARIQKALKLADMQKYLNGTFDPKAFGFQALVGDVSGLDTSQQLIAGLRLDYPGGFAGQTTLALLVFFQDASFRMTAPYDPSLGEYPYTGNGFTADTEARAIPEWVVPKSGVNLQEGSQLLTVDQAGNHVLQATLTGGPWITPAGLPASRQSGRERVERVARYAGVDLFLISQDDEFFYFNASQPVAGATQVGRSEFRGRIRRADLP